MRLAYSTWPEITDFIKHTSTIIIPIGSNEQHGPIGLLGTDWMCPEIIALAAEKMAQALDYRSRFPDGRIGADSSLATIAFGEKIIAASVAGLLKDVAEFSIDRKAVLQSSLS